MVTASSSSPDSTQQPHTEQRLRVWLSWSSGKDCSWALHTLRQQAGVHVVGLLTTLNGKANRVAMHAVRAQLLQQQAAATGLPVHQVMLPFPCSNEDYQQRMAGAIDAAKAAGVDAIAFGDLFLADVRAYREKMMAPTGLRTLFPLWTGDTRKSTQQLALEMLTAGVRAVLTCVDLKRLPASFAGRSWDAQLLAELPPGVDPCGENGEFHTYVFDGPMLQQPVAIKPGSTVTRDGFAFCDILPADYDEELAAAEAAAAEAEAAEAARQQAEGGSSAAVVCPPPPQADAAAATTEGRAGVAAAAAASAEQ